MTDTAIGRQTSSYRQGLVLGLTMAEIMLLLVFCLLIAVGVALSTERTKRDDALARLNRAETSAAANQKLADIIKRNQLLAELIARAAKLGSQSEIDDFWRKLVERNDAVSHIESQGVSLSALEQANLVRLRELMAQGLDPEKAAKDAAFAAAIEAMLADRDLARLSPQELAALLDKGIE